MTEIHFLNVGCGNMQLILLPDGSIFMYDCNITEANQGAILSYLKKVIGIGAKIDVFINSHRDADHMRGIKKLHNKHPIRDIWDSGVSGTTTTSSEYNEYMYLRRQLSSGEIESRNYWKYGSAILRCMNSKCEEYPDPNDQSVVLKIEDNGPSVILSGDTSFRPWKEKILVYYPGNRLHADILLASHHGSLDFFDDPSDTTHYFTKHIRSISPAMTLVSVGPNRNDLPNQEAISLYEKYSRGSDKGNKVYTTAEKGNMKLILKDDGTWNLKISQ